MIEDEYLLAALRLASDSDPAPAVVSADALAAFALRIPGVLTADPVSLPEPSGARTVEGPRLHRFAGGDLTIDVEFALCGGRIDVAGQVSTDVSAHGAATDHPSPDSPSVWLLEGDGRIEIRTLHGSEVRVPSESGHFAATGLPPGWLSVTCHRPGHAPVATRWLCVRD